MPLSGVLRYKSRNIADRSADEPRVEAEIDSSPYNSLAKVGLLTVWRMNSVINAFLLLAAICKALYLQPSCGT